MHPDISKSREEFRTFPEPCEANYHTALAHLYRGEMQRLTVWRQRLDVTSNWAILLVIALTTFILGADDVPHYALLLGLVLTGISALIEGRRYRHLHHSCWRIYLMEQGYFANILCSADAPRIAEWQRLLFDDLRHPRLLISWFIGTGVRFRRNYLMIVYFITAAWITKLLIHPARPKSLNEFIDHLAIGDWIPPWIVIISTLVIVGGATGFALYCPKAEKIEKWNGAFVDSAHEHLNVG